MAKYIDAEKIPNDSFFNGLTDKEKAKVLQWFLQAPTADVVEVETIKSWLYEMAINNVGYVIDGDFSTACEEIISRLDGLRNFARERSDTE